MITKDYLTAEEINALLKANPQKYLPEGIIWDGYTYSNEEGVKSSDHPSITIHIMLM